MNIEENIPLAPLTTMRVGGRARYLAACASEADILEALKFAREKKLPLYILGAGSNTLFSDAGFDGVVIKIALKGISFAATADGAQATVAAGELWDDFVEQAVGRGLSGIECLSGIPGTVGATPVQNVGAYGQSVGDTIESLWAIEIESGHMVELAAADCGFGYRASRFKNTEAGKYIITSVVFKLSSKKEPEAKYPDLIEELEKTAPDFETKNLSEKLRLMRQTVLVIRQRKGMVWETSEKSLRSCGSFFTNVVLSAEELKAASKKYLAAGGIAPIPTHESEGKFKISAAWLIEQAGFKKGERRGEVGLAPNHVLAIVNYGAATTSDILNFATEIQAAVNNKFGIQLEREPVVVQQDQ